MCGARVRAGRWRFSRRALRRRQNRRTAIPLSSNSLAPPSPASDPRLGAKEPRETLVDLLLRILFTGRALFGRSRWLRWRPLPKLEGRRLLQTSPFGLSR